MNTQIAVALIVALCACSHAGQAANENENPSIVVEEEIGGTLINQTKTSIGQRFFQAISEVHIAQQQLQHLNFVVHERSSARWGSLIWINNGQKEVYRQFLSPAQRDFSNVAKHAYQTISEYTSHFELQKLLGDHFDIDKDEF